jgi:hypothetical protein
LHFTGGVLLIPQHAVYFGVEKRNWLEQGIPLSNKGSEASGFRQARAPYPGIKMYIRAICYTWNLPRLKNAMILTFNSPPLRPTMARGRRSGDGISGES